MEKLDLDEAVRIIAGRMSRRAREIKKDVPIIMMVEQAMAELGCKNYEELLKKLLESPREVYDFALTKLEKISDSFLSMLFTNVFSRFNLENSGAVFLEALRTGDKAIIEEIFMKVAEAIKIMEKNNW